MTIIQKIVKAKDLPPKWAKEFADPEMKVVVRLAEIKNERPDGRIVPAEELSDARTAVRGTEDFPKTE